MSLLKKSFLIILIFITSCSYNEGEHEPLFGLWKSNIPLSIEALSIKGNHKNAQKREAFIKEEFGKLYHYYSKDTFALIYSSSIDADRLLKKLVNEEDIALNDGEFIEFYDYKVLEKGKGYYTIKISKNFLHTVREYKLYFPEKNCFHMDNSIYRDALDEVFCKINEQSSLQKKTGKVQ